MSEVEARRQAVSRLADAIRVLNLASVLSEAPVATFERVAEAAEALAVDLRSRARLPSTLASVDDVELGVRMYSPVTGAGNPSSLRVHLLPEGPDLCAVGQVTLTPQHEGHVGFAHGGIIAMLFDEVLGTAASRRVWPSVTTSLTVRYRRPVPIGTGLRVTGTVETIDGRRIEVSGTITAEEAPNVTLAEGRGTFVELSRERAIGMLGSDLRRVEGVAVKASPQQP